MDPSDPAPDTIETSFLLTNIHCPSCVANIENALYALSPRPFVVSPSIVTSWVTVRHAPELDISTIQHALIEAGFGISSITENGIARDVANLNGSADFKDVHGTLDSLLERSGWFGGPMHSGKTEELERIKARHIQDCDLCRTEGYQDTSPKAKLSAAPSNQPLLKSDTHVVRMDSHKQPSPSSSQQPFVVIDEGKQDIWRASVAIGGMTCASCSNSIATELEKRSWVRNVTVNLITNSASVDVVGKSHFDEVISIIEDLGYEAVLNSVSDTKSAEDKDIWRASIAVGGMTCGTCSAAVTNALEKKEWVKEVTVNLIANSATVDFRDENHLDEILETIKDLGYEAALDKVVDLGKSAQITQRRTVEINVSEMFCGHCPEKVLQSLEVFGDAIRIEKPLSIKDPIIRLSYVPQLPHFTIRDIIATIAGLDPKFKVSIYHPPTLEERSYELHAQQQRRLLIRVALSVIIAIPTLVIGIVFMSLVPSPNSSKDWLMAPWKANVSRAQWILLLLSIPVYFLAADVFHRRAIKEIHFLWRRSSKTPILRRFYRFGSMNMLMSLGTSIAFWASVAQMISAGVNNTPHVAESNFYFDSVVFLTMFLLIGRYIEAYSKSRTGDAVTLLTKLRPTEAVLVNSNGQLAQVSVDLLEVGDTVRVMHGASPPSDGTILGGETNFDESSLTGESKLVKKQIADSVFSGTINKGSPVTIVINSTTGTAMLDQIVQAVREGQTKRAPIERMADSLTSYFVPVITAIAILTWLIWLSLGLSGRLPDDYLDDHNTQGGWITWSLQFAISVFVVACPCGLALAAPTALFVGGGLAAQNGILVKGGGSAFEKASRLDTIVFDKTGTLTMGGEPAVTEYLSLSVFGTPHPVVAERNLLSYISSAESNSTHPLAKALVSFCAVQSSVSKDADSIEKPQLIEVHELPGRGMRALALLDQSLTEILIGNEALMSDFCIPIPESAANILSTWKREGNSVVLVGISRPHPQSSTPTPPSTPPSDPFRHLSAMFAISDPIRPAAPHLIRSLHAAGTHTWLLTGDNPITAHAVGIKLGIPPQNIIAGVMPSEKADRIRDLQRSMPTSASGRRSLIGMVGDGINDAPALAAADVGIAMGAGSDIAISAADFVLVSSELRSLSTLLQLSRVVFRRIKFNFGWAMVYNMVALPVAAGAFYALTPGGKHVMLDPVWASLAMAASSVSVVLSSLALRWPVPGIGFRVDRSIELDAERDMEERPIVRGR